MVDISRGYTTVPNPHTSERVDIKRGKGRY